MHWYIPFLLRWKVIQLHFVQLFDFSGAVSRLSTYFIIHYNSMIFQMFFSFWFCQSYSLVLIFCISGLFKRKMTDKILPKKNYRGFLKVKTKYFKTMKVKLERISVIQGLYVRILSTNANIFTCLFKNIYPNMVWNGKMSRHFSFDCFYVWLNLTKC